MKFLNPSMTFEGAPNKHREGFYYKTNFNTIKITTNPKELILNMADTT